MKELALFFISIVLCTSASAEFTAVEKQQIVNQIEAMDDAMMSLLWATDHVVSHPNDRDILTSFAATLLAERRRHMDGLLYLTDGNARVPGDRTQAVIDGKAKIDQVWYSGARNILDDLSSSTERTNALNNLDDALAGLNSFDASLPYSEPRLNVNLAFPGASRLTSATAGPHGDYQYAAWMMVGEQDNNMIKSLERFFDAYEANPLSESNLFDAVHHTQLILQHAGWAVGLLVGAETSDVASHVDAMEAGGTTTRGREFFQILLAMEMMLNRVDVGPDLLDVNGRTMIRGSTYDMTRVCQEIQRTIRLDPAIPQYIIDFTWSVEFLCQAWQHMDSGTFNGTLGLKHFQVFGPPPPSSEVCDLCGSGGGQTCGPGTHDDGAGMCVPDSNLACGPGTTEIDEECVADIQSCPTYVPELDYLTGSIVARCVEQP